MIVEKPMSEDLQTDLLEAIHESRRFQQPLHYCMLYATSGAVMVMFIIICALSTWSA